MKDLTQFLEEKADKVELISSRSGDDDGGNMVRISHYRRTTTKLEWIENLLNDLYVVEEADDGVFLRPRPLATDSNPHAEGTKNKTLK